MAMTVNTTRDVTWAAVTTPEPPYSIAPGWGLLGVAVAAVFFGSNLIPIKKFETGDGMFFQWMYCISIWIVGFVLNGIRNFPPFHPLAMLGGFLWCTGNVLVVPILQTIGLGQGILLWASVNMLSGWAVGRFGWFGLIPSLPASEILNGFGVALCCISFVLYLFIKTTTTTKQDSRPLSEPEQPPLVDKQVTESVTADTAAGDVVFYDRLSPVTRRIVGSCMAVIAGLFFGLNFTPVIYMQENWENVSRNGLDYVFAHFTGILATSTTYMAVYCAVMRNRPRVYPRVILPGFASGIMWGIADIGWFIANDALAEPISFPIITSLPALIGMLWGMILFREIKGKRNYIILATAACVAITGSVLTALSKWNWYGQADGDDHNSTFHTTTSTTV